MDIPSSFPVPTWDSDALCNYLGIQNYERVLEIGAGHNPFLRANVVVDIDFHSGEHRDGHSMRLTADKIYIQADLTALPFKDKSFDWVICLHVLEHVSNPALACEELMRVAKKGLIETPRKWTEYYAGHPTHRWLIDEKDDILIFEPILWLESPFLNFALPSVWSSVPLLNAAETRFRHIPCVQKIWHDTFEYHVTEPLNLTKWNIQSQAIRHYSFAKNLLYWMADPKMTIFHAKTAHKLGIEDSHKLYGCYLIMCGRYKEAFFLLKNLPFYFRILLASLILKIRNISTIIVRKLLSPLLQ